MTAFNPRPKGKKGKTSLISKTRQEELRKYNSVKASKKEDMIVGKFYVCYFSGKRLDENTDYPWHHIFGRKGKLLYDYKNIFPCIHDYHMEYHEMPIEKLMKLDWYKQFIDRLSRINHAAYNLELKRMNRGGIIDDSQFFKMWK
jgi:hypothetical protein